MGQRFTSPIVPTASHSPGRAECDALLERICASSQFQRSARLRELLCHLVRHGLAGDHAALKEAAVGHAIYGRPEGYNTNDDNIVRMGVSQLRRKLQEYFEDEGKSETLRFEFPKGSYVPVFNMYPPSPKDIPIDTPAGSAPEVRRRELRFDRRFALILAFAALVVLPAAFLLLEGRPRGAAGDTANSLDRFWRGAIGDGRSTVFVSEDIDYLISSEVSRNGQPTLADLEAYAAENTRTQRAAVQATSQLSLRTCARFLAVQPSRFSHVSITSSREIRTQDFKGRNVILMGSPRACPWIELFDKSLSFHFEFDKSRNQSRFRNPRPRTGEQVFYTASRFDDLGGRVYSLVALLPNLDHTGKVLILTGTRAEGTGAAADAVSTPGTVDRILESIGCSRQSSLPYFEVLLESQLVDGVNLAPRILASRVYPANPASRASAADLR